MTVPASYLANLLVHGGYQSDITGVPLQRQQGVHGLAAGYNGRGAPLCRPGVALEQLTIFIPQHVCHGALPGAVIHPCCGVCIQPAWADKPWIGHHNLIGFWLLKLRTQLAWVYCLDTNVVLKVEVILAMTKSIDSTLDTCRSCCVLRWVSCLCNVAGPNTLLKLQCQAVMQSCKHGLCWVGFSVKLKQTHQSHLGKSNVTAEAEHSPQERLVAVQGQLE